MSIASILTNNFYGTNAADLDSQFAAVTEGTTFKKITVVLNLDDNSIVTGVPPAAHSPTEAAYLVDAIALLVTGTAVATSVIDASNVETAGVYPDAGPARSLVVVVLVKPNVSDNKMRVVAKRMNEITNTTYPFGEDLAGTVATFVVEAVLSSRISVRTSSTVQNTVLAATAAGVVGVVVVAGSY